jgi:signal peptidase II
LSDSRTSQSQLPDAAENRTTQFERAISKGSWIALLVIIADQASKFLAEEFLVLHQPVAVFPFLNFTLAYNTGAAFSFLHQAGGWQNTFFIVIAFIMSAVLLVMLYRAPRKDLQFSISLWLVLGGALGNVIDRLRIQKVVDFIDFYVGEWHFATFNVADMAISIGAFLLITDAFNLRLFKYRSER